VKAWLALLATLPILAVGSGATASGSAPSRNGLIAVRGGEGIYLVDPRTETASLVPNTENLGEPAWSPDGALLAVTSFDQESDSVYTMKPDGSERNLVLWGAYSPSWSPDGKRLVVVRDPCAADRLCTEADEGASALAVVNADGTVEVGLEGTADASVPQWSPDGKRIAFIDSNGRVALITPDGETVSMPSKIEAESVSWSPDSAKLAYAGYRGKDETGEVVVALVDLASGHETLLAGAQGGAESPVWSPDGDQLVFLSKTLVKASNGGCGSQAASELWVMGADGTKAHKAASTLAAYGPASWARAADPVPMPVRVPTASGPAAPQWNCRTTLRRVRRWGVSHANEPFPVGCLRRPAGIAMLGAAQAGTAGRGCLPGAGGLLLDLRGGNRRVQALGVDQRFALSKRVHRTALDQRLDDPLVDGV
jgi:dipeptidyl aminopeptidase/acylaminoacyl peptidase